MQTELNERVRVFFDFMFGDDTIPVKAFEEDDEEMAYLDEGRLYGTMGECRAHDGLSPFIVSLGYHDDELLWRGTCMQCWAQLRVPVSQTEDDDWTLHVDDSRMVGLDPVPAYEENNLTPEPDDE